MDQPYRGIVEMYLGLQWYPPNNPRPYDDTGWSIPLLHNIKVIRVDDKTILDQPMTTMTANAKYAGTITGTGSTIVIDHTTDNALATFRWANPTREDVGGRAAVRPRRPPVRRRRVRDRRTPIARRSSRRSATWGCRPGRPTRRRRCRMHDLDVPRIGYIHSWQNTQEEGWVRMGLDMYKIPYTYFGDNEVRKGDLRAKYDVILYPSAGVQIDGARHAAGRHAAAVPQDATRRRASPPRPIRPTTGAAASAATACASSRSSSKRAAS